LTALVGHGLALPMNVAASVQDNKQFEAVCAGLRFHGGKEFPTLGGEIAAGGQQGFVDALAGQMQGRHFGGRRSVEVHNFQSFLDV